MQCTNWPSFEQLQVCSYSCCTGWNDVGKVFVQLGVGFDHGFFAMICYKYCRFGIFYWICCRWLQADVMEWAMVTADYCDTMEMYDLVQVCCHELLMLKTWCKVYMVNCRVLVGCLLQGLVC